MKYHIFWGPVCSLSYATCHAKCMQLTLPFVACSALPNFSTLSHKRYDFRENELLNIYVFWFSRLVVSEIFRIRRILSEICSKVCICLQVQYPLFLSDFNESWVFPTDFRKIFKYHISWKSDRWDGRTDGHDEANSRFSQFLRTRIKTFCSKMSKLCYKRICSNEKSDLNQTFSFKYSAYKNGATVLYLPYEFVSFRFNKYCTHPLLPFLSL
jgi:hypothetical protein